ncbi:hypothetical protein C4K88_00965 [Arthrobacter pityocampae]|uniref:DUF2970 domain-containing protein n=1 Tax=Arthrobacter pityocampae TaxID=547334 RepID=A0A2S5J185_9MICC|nr:hypothetical protein [Arthrobacter pityocampae]PPB50500.1 hypothetical protein C4K88_00965 [Arthrobacter pityocampae]
MDGVLGRREWNRRTAILVVGASMLALCIAARRLGLGVDDDGGPPALWLALLFVIGASLVSIVLVQRLIEILTKR